MDGLLQSIPADYIEPASKQFLFVFASKHQESILTSRCISKELNQLGMTARMIDLSHIVILLLPLTHLVLRFDFFLCMYIYSPQGDRISGRWDMYMYIGRVLPFSWLLLFEIHNWPYPQERPEEEGFPQYGIGYHSHYSFWSRR